MRGGIFGWSLPPGCSMRDIDPPDYPCPMCAKDPAECECEECPTCGDQPCLKHWPTANVVMQMDTAEARFRYLEAEYKRRLEAGKYVCVCGTPITPDLREGMDYCEKCNDWATKAVTQ